MADEKKEATPKTASQVNGEAEKKEKGKGCRDAAVLVAAIGVIPAIFGLILAFPPFIAWVTGFITPTTTISKSPTPLVVEIPTFTPVYQTLSPSTSETLSPTFTPVAPTVSSIQVMWGEVDLDVQPRYEGKIPFRVTFNLQRSKFMLANGETVYCRNVDTCQYSWKIYRDGLFLEKYENSDGILVYTFTGYGVYIVVADVCEDTICAKKQAEIVVK